MTGDPAPHTVYLERAHDTLDAIGSTQSDAIVRTAEICAGAILSGGLVHLFGSGHSRIAVEEMYPRYGSFAGFHPIVELSMTNHHQVVGANGQRQAMFIENVEGLGRVILGNFALDPERDVMMVISAGGTNAVPVEVVLECKQMGVPTVAVTSVAHSRQSTPKHSSGKRLFEVADLVIDTCTPPGDAAVPIAGLDTPVAPLTSLAAVTIVNMIKADVAQRLTDEGHPPAVLTSAVLVGAERSDALFERSYDDYRTRTRRL